MICLQFKDDVTSVEKTVKASITVFFFLHFAAPTTDARVFHLRSLFTP